MKETVLFVFFYYRTFTEEIFFINKKILVIKRVFVYRVIQEEDNRISQRGVDQ